MAYSTIEKKRCKCGCNRFPTISCFGYNYNCLPPDLKEKAGTRRKVAIKNRNRRIAIAHKIHIAQKEMDGGYSEKLSLWFKYQMSISEKKCDNCGISLAHYSEDDWYGSQHHIVEKSLCPSVAAHPLNHLVLGKWCCHGQWHSCWSNASVMPIFEEAKRRYKLFKDCIAPEELKKVNPYLCNGLI